MSERSAATAVPSPVPSLLSRALDLYVGGWGGQAVLYGITFVLALVVALVAERGFAMSTGYTLLLVVATTVVLLVCLPLGYAVRFSPEAKVKRRLKFYADRLRLLDVESVLASHEEALRLHGEHIRKEREEGRYYEVRSYARRETEAEQMFKEAFLSVFLNLFITERERRRYEDVSAPGERDYEAATSAAAQALGLFIMLHSIEVLNVDKEELVAAMHDAMNVTEPRRSHPHP